MLLLHGGFETADYWKLLTGPLGEHFTTIAVDSRGHVRTTGTAASMTYSRLARDAVGLLDHLGIESAHLVGHSDGGSTTLHLLVDFADRVTSATLIGTPYSTANYPPNVMAHLRKFLADARAGTALRRHAAIYREMAPRPDYWPTLLDKVGEMWLTEPQFTLETLSAVRRPVLVLDAGADQFLPSSVFKALAEAIPNAKLKSIPNGTHNVVLEHPEEVVAAVLDFIRSR